MVIVRDIFHFASVHSSFYTSQSRNRGYYNLVKFDVRSLLILQNYREGPLKTNVIGPFVGEASWQVVDRV